MPCAPPAAAAAAEAEAEAAASAAMAFGLLRSEAKREAGAFVCVSNCAVTRVCSRSLPRSLHATHMVTLLVTSRVL